MASSDLEGKLVVMPVAAVTLNVGVLVAVIWLGLETSCSRMGDVMPKLASGVALVKTPG